MSAQHAPGLGMYRDGFWSPGEWLEIISLAESHRANRARAATMKSEGRDPAWPQTYARRTAESLRLRASNAQAMFAREARTRAAIARPPLKPTCSRSCADFMLQSKRIAKRWLRSPMRSTR